MQNPNTVHARKMIEELTEMINNQTKRTAVGHVPVKKAHVEQITAIAQTYALVSIAESLEALVTLQDADEANELSFVELKQ